MVRLDRNTRYQITSALKTSALRNLEKVESYGVWDLTFEETEDNKISSRLCLLLAIALDLSLDGCSPLEIPISFLTCCCNNREDIDDFTIEESSDLYGEMQSLSGNFFYAILQQTSWNIKYLDDYSSLDLLSDEEALTLSSQLPYLLNYVSSVKDYPSKEEYEQLLQRFKALNITEIKYSEFEDCSILFLFNPVIKKAMELCRNNPSLATLPEKKEIQDYFHFKLMRRYFYYSFSTVETAEIAYIFGMCISDVEEYSDFYYLSWEAVVALVLAEMAALDIIDYAERTKLGSYSEKNVDDPVNIK